MASGPMFTPGLVSIGLPTYNRAELLRATIDGLLRQDYRPLEIIVSDNCSTDATRAVVAEYVARHPEVRYVRQPCPVPVAENFRTPLRLATGEFFMWAADDDDRTETFVSTLARVLAMEPGTVLAAGEARYQLPDGTPLTYFPEGQDWYGMDLYRSAEGRLAKVIDSSYGNLIYGLYRRQALVTSSATIFDGWRSLNELPVFLQVAARGEIRVVPDVLMNKTAPLEVFIAAAHEYGVDPPERLAGASTGLHGVRHAAARSRQVVAYHAAALVDALGATRTLPVPGSVRARTALRLTGRLFRHSLSTVRGVARVGRVPIK